MTLFFKDEDGDVFEETRTYMGEDGAITADLWEDDDIVTPGEAGFMKGFEE